MMVMRIPAPRWLTDSAPPPSFFPHPEFLPASENRGVVTTTPTPVSPVTRLIAQVGDGDESARQDLWALVYDELRQLASSQMRRERNSHTLQPTALVNEAYVRLVADAAGFEGRAHFFGAAASAMRRILVDHARQRGTEKRGGGRERVPLSRAPVGLAGGELDADLDIEALDRALSLLEQEQRHVRKVRVVSLRFFAGLTIDQTAKVLSVAPASVKRDWEFAKAWLLRQMNVEGDA